MQVQHDPRARRAGGGQRAPAERRRRVVGVHDARAGAPDGVRDLAPAAARRPAGPSAAAPRPTAPSRARAPRRPRPGARGSATRGPRPPAPRRPRGGSGGGAGGSRPQGYSPTLLTAPWPASSFRRGGGATTSRSRSRPSPPRRPRAAPRSSSSRTSRRTPRRRRWPSATARRYIALGGRAGLNVARNTCDRSGHRRADLLARRRRRGLAGLARRDARGRRGEPGARGARRPDPAAASRASRLRSCGREPLPITALDLGTEDTDAEFVWGANLDAPPGAFERVGRFDARSRICGDEKEWETRLKAAGGRIRYVAAAGVDHRRAGRDARVARLSRAAYHRGRDSRLQRRAQGRSRRRPAAELRTLAGCVWHTGRRAVRRRDRAHRAERRAASRRRSTRARSRRARPTRTSSPAARARSASARR